MKAKIKRNKVIIIQSRTQSVLRCILKPVYENFNRKILVR